MNSINAAVQRLKVNESGLATAKSIAFLKNFGLDFLLCLLVCFFCFWFLDQEPKFPLLLHVALSEGVIPMTLADANNF